MGVTRREFMSWLHDTYDMNEVKFSPQLNIDLKKVVNGTYQGLRVPVPYDDLIDMWQRKWGYLEKLNAQKHLIGERRIRYDLSIILSKYDSYLTWKAEQEAERQRVVKEHNDLKIDYSMIPTLSHTTISDSELLGNGNELLGVLDDIIIK